MEELIKKYSAIDRCPIRNVISHFSSKWGILILLVLGEAEKLRFNEIYKILPDISPKVLSSTLKSLEQDKLVTRTIYATIPPKVEYRISEDGRTLLPILQELWVSRFLVGINFRHPNVMPNFAVWKTITYRHWHRWCCQPRF